MSFHPAVFLLGLAVAGAGEVTVTRLLTATAFSTGYSPLYEELLLRSLSHEKHRQTFSLLH